MQRFENNDRQVRQSMRENSLRWGRIETRVSQIEAHGMAFKRANARILAQEQKGREQLARLVFGYSGPAPPRLVRCSRNLLQVLRRSTGTRKGQWPDTAARNTGL